MKSACTKLECNKTISVNFDEYGNTVKYDKYKLQYVKN